MSGCKSWISGCSGLSLTADERAFFRDERPWGFILFGRNIAERAQVRDLVAELKDIGGRPDVPVLIDQEGGRVQRLRPPLAHRFPPSGQIGALWHRSQDSAKRAAWLQGRLLAADLRDGYGINVNCVPCLDLPQANSHSVIGDRAYGEEPEVVAALGGSAAEGLMAGGVVPVMKHLPGHGRSQADSHLEMPRVEATRAELAAHDFQPFQALRDLPAAMTAHLLFESIDPDRPGTLSPIVVGDVIRKEIGFDGLLMTDDMSMKALDGPMDVLATQAIEAGCDLALHCNGDMTEMRSIASAVPELAGRSLDRAARALARAAGSRQPGDAEALREEFQALLAGVSA